MLAYDKLSTNCRLNKKPKLFLNMLIKLINRLVSTLSVTISKLLGTQNPSRTINQNKLLWLENCFCYHVL
jgi:hypothetical protein